MGRGDISEATDALDDLRELPGVLCAFGSMREVGRVRGSKWRVGIGPALRSLALNGENWERREFGSMER